MSVNMASREELIDVLRGVAIAGVVSVHVAQISFNSSDNNSKMFFDFFSFGRYGVELFFMVSGYLLFKLYGKDQNVNLNKYLVRRFARIYPLWLLFLCLNVFLALYLDKLDHKTFLSNFDTKNSGIILAIVLGTTFTLFFSSTLWNSVIPGSWSIQAEVAHYLIFPIIQKVKFLYVIVSLIAINLLTLFSKNFNFLNQYIKSRIFLSIFFESWMRLSIFTTFGFFILGGLYYKYVNEYSGASFSICLKSIPKIYTFAGFSYLFTLLLLPIPFGNTYQALIFVFLSISIGTLLNKGAGTRITFCTLGKYSYFIYFFHFLVLDLLKLGLNLKFLDQRNIFTFLVIYACTVAICLVIARFSMKFIENPIIDFARRRT